MSVPGTPAPVPAPKGLGALIAAFSPGAERLEPPPVCWIGNAGDAGSDYCPTCCEALVDTSNYMMARTEDDAWVVDGGWEAERESDGPATCEGCGCTLGYALTLEGLHDEIAHFEGTAEPWVHQPFGDEQAYAIRAVLEAAAHYGDPGLASSAVTIGNAALAAARGSLPGVEVTEIPRPASGPDASLAEAGSGARSLGVVPGLGLGP